MEIDIQQQRERFLKICREMIHREGLEELLAWLDKKGFFTAPASSRFHGAYEGGLCQHSLDVYDYANRLLPLIEGTFSQESVAIASLFHDVCKVGLYKQDFRNQKINGNWEQVPFYTIDESFAFGGHGSKSVYLVQWFMKLNQEEAVAINCHMGFSDGNLNTVRDVGNAFTMFHLAWIIHVADEAATYLIAKERV